MTFQSRLKLVQYLQDHNCEIADMGLTELRVLERGGTIREKIVILPYNKRSIDKYLRERA